MRGAGHLFFARLEQPKQAVPPLPRSLSRWSFGVVASYLLFFVLVVLYETGNVGRNSPVFFEWLCFFTSMGWLAAHVYFLGRETSAA